MSEVETPGPAAPPEPDLLVIGAGPTGMYAAALAAARGLDVLLVEADDLLGGSASRGDGTMWLPDDTSEARAYVTALGATERAADVVTHATAVRDSLAALGVRLQPVPEPDAHPLDGAGRDRIWEPAATNARHLKEDRALIRMSESSITYTDALRMFVALRQPIGLARVARVLGGRAILSRAAGRQPVVGGSALVVGLMAALVAGKVTIWSGSPLVGLVGGERAAAVVRHDGSDQVIRPRRGVLLAAGGYSFDPDRRLTHLGAHADPTISMSAPRNDGSVLTAAIAIGADHGGYRDAEWRPSVVTASGHVHPIDLERCLPFGIVVDATGNRFHNEAAPGVELGRAMMARARELRTDAVHLVTDDRHRKRYPIGPWPPRFVPSRGEASGDLVRSDTVIGLAGELGIDKAGLVGQVTAFNGFVKKGVDADFGRGQSPADKAKGQPMHRGNPSLGSLERPPYWGVRLRAAEVSTRGGVITDSSARVLDAAGRPIPGLFAAGAIAAMPWGHREPGPGAGCAASLTGAYAAVDAVTTGFGRPAGPVD